VLEAELAFANEFAEDAAKIGLSYFGGKLQVRQKADLSPVTEADTSIEGLFREAVAGRFRGDAVLGEEGGLQGEGRDGRRWIIDPIDGTKNFADGVQVWATLIAFAIDGEPLLGLVSAPALAERYEAVRGGGARLNGEPIRVSRVDRVSRSFVLYSSLDKLLSGPRADAFRALAMEARRTRGFGDFWGHMLVARGTADVMMEEELATWDWAAASVIVREAGGEITQMDGASLAHGGSVLTTNGLMHDEMVARLRL
jgi:histidinol-phosphatase